MPHYHVSPRKNRTSIQKVGLEPIFSTGKKQAVWFVSLDRILWAVTHCSARHGVPVSELDVWVIQNVDRIVRTRLVGVFFSTCRVIPRNHVPATHFCQDMNEQ